MQFYNKGQFWLGFFPNFPSPSEIFLNFYSLIKKLGKNNNTQLSYRLPVKLANSDKWMKKRRHSCTDLCLEAVNTFAKHLPMQPGDIFSTCCHGYLDFHKGASLPPWNRLIARRGEPISWQQDVSPTLVCILLMIHLSCYTWFNELCMIWLCATFDPYNTWFW